MQSGTVRSWGVATPHAVERAGTVKGALPPRAKALTPRIFKAK